MLWTPLALNRTLLHRQGLLARTAASPTTRVEWLVEHLVGLQAQEPFSPYAGLAARLDGFDPRSVSGLLARRRLVRMIVMRGTIHLLVPEDALSLRAWVQPRLEQERRHSQYARPAVHLDPVDVRAAVASVLAGGPLAQADLGIALADAFPDVPPAALAQIARIDCPLVQVPPRGSWREAGGVVYDLVTSYLDRPAAELDVPRLVRRYLAAYGPATAADLTAWSGVTRLTPVLRGLDDLVRHPGPGGTLLYDVPGGEPVTDAAAPVRLLGTYDNVWLAHAARDRVTAPDRRKRWMGANGGTGCAILVDGWLEGLWRVGDDRRPAVVELFRALTARERSQLDDELDRMAELLAVPPADSRG